MGADRRGADLERRAKPDASIDHQERHRCAHDPGTRTQGALPWMVLPELGVRVSKTDRPEPDVLVIPSDHRSVDRRERDVSNVIVAFEVLSPSTEGRDLRWKRRAYTGLASPTHYVVIAQDAIEVTVFARDDDFAERRIRSIDKTIELRSPGISLPVAEIYRDTGLVEIA
jgi:Uma2 family endonuclease